MLKVIKAVNIDELVSKLNAESMIRHTIVSETCAVIDVLKVSEEKIVVIKKSDDKTVSIENGQETVVESKPKKA